MELSLLPFWCRAYDCENNGDLDVESSRNIEDPDEAVAYCQDLMNRQPPGRYIVKAQLLQSVPEEHVRRFQQRAAELGVTLEDGFA